MGDILCLIQIPYVAPVNDLTGYLDKVRNVSLRAHLNRLNTLS